MSAVEEELEEGEITDSDSTGEEHKPAETERPPTQHYSIFDSQPRATPATKNILQSDSDNGDDDDSYSDDDDGAKKRKCHANRTGFNHMKTFVNPNFVNNGGKMPPVPDHSKKRTIWSSILQEQILSTEVGNFSMERKVSCDRDVESYDYSRAKDDDRPFPLEDDMKNTEEELFGEVIDFEKTAFKQRRYLKRKHVADRLGKRPSVKERLQLPKVTESSSMEDVTFYISNELQETKVHLIRRVVNVVGRTKALDLLRETERVEAGGGMLIMNGSRRRTPGGVYLTLLKKDNTVSKEQQDEIFEEENKWRLEMKMRKKARSRRRRKECKGQQTPLNVPAKEDEGGSKTHSMEGVEDGNSRSSVEGQTGSPRNPADHWSDTPEGLDPKDKDLALSDSEEEEERSEVGDYQTDLAHELKRQAADAGTTKETSTDAAADAITLDDVLDLEEDDDFID